MTPTRLQFLLMLMDPVSRAFEKQPRRAEKRAPERYRCQDIKIEGLPLTLNPFWRGR